jgi:phospholipid transport system substrate-binding protein
LDKPRKVGAFFADVDRHVVNISPSARRAERTARRVTMRMPMLVLCILLSTAAWSAFGATGASDPSALVVGLRVQLRQIVADGSLTPLERQRRFRGLVDEGFDFPIISRFVLGRYWQGASDTSRREFAGVFEDYVIQSFGERLSDYSGESMNVTATRSEGDHNTLVSTSITLPNGAPPAQVDWEVLETASGFKITDISVSGISMAISYRDQFAAIIDRNGGRMSTLISDLRAKLDGPPRASAFGDNAAEAGSP